jgi:dihydropteroate synthase
MFGETGFSRKKTPLPLPGGGELDFSRPLLMSIVNCTPDSFYTESRRPGTEDALRAAFEAEEEGAAIIDFGAESTRPGAAPVSARTEIARLTPALRSFRERSSLPVSVDTRKAAVARAALDEGADIINDVSALSDPDMASLCAERGAALVLMYLRPSHFGAAWDLPVINKKRTGFPHRIEPSYGGLPPAVTETRKFLYAAAEYAAEHGVAREMIILDPGIGFGKTFEENLALINYLAETVPPGYPVMAGLSRKRCIGEMTGQDTAGRLAGTLAACYAALCAGADILRVHDTAAARDIVAVFCALAENRRGVHELVSENN